MFSCFLHALIISYPITKQLQNVHSCCRYWETKAANSDEEGEAGTWDGPGKAGVFSGV